MTQNEKWLKRYQQVMDFMQAHHRNPSRHRTEEHQMLNFIKYNRKLMRAEKLPPERRPLFDKLQASIEQLKRINQWTAPADLFGRHL